jgi:hypothetical protein
MSVGWPPPSGNRTVSCKTSWSTGCGNVGTEEALVCFVWLPFLADDGGEGLTRDADTMVVSRERSKGSPMRKSRG